MKRLVLACFMVLGAHDAGAQTLYKCVLAGKTIYQGEACPESAQQQTLEAPPPGPARSPSVNDAPSKGAKNAPAKIAPPAGDSELDAAIDVMAGYRACSDAIMEWESANRTAYEAWRMRSNALVSRIENDVEAQRKYAQKVEANRNGTSRTCANVLAVIKPGDTEFMKDVRKELGARKPNP